MIHSTGKRAECTGTANPGENLRRGPSECHADRRKDPWTGWLGPPHCGSSQSTVTSSCDQAWEGQSVKDAQLKEQDEGDSWRWCGEVCWAGCWATDTKRERDKGHMWLLWAERYTTVLGWCRASTCSLNLCIMPPGRRLRVEISVYIVVTAREIKNGLKANQGQYCPPSCCPPLVPHHTHTLYP